MPLRKAPHGLKLFAISKDRLVSSSPSLQMLADAKVHPLHYKLTFHSDGDMLQSSAFIDYVTEVRAYLDLGMAKGSILTV